MATRFPIHRFIDDLIVADRRLSEKTDLKISVERQGQLSEFPYPVRNRVLNGSFGLRLSKAGEGLLEIATNRKLDEHEHERIKLLALLLTYCGSKDRLLLADQIGSVLREVRQTLGISQQDVADQVGTTRIAVSRWEPGAQAPGVAAMYRWCQALAIVSPQRTAVVRSVDFSPLLLRFLQEDPTRLRSLTPDEFERFVAERLDRMGYTVTLTGNANRKDGGIDLIAFPKSPNLGSHVIAGQVKHHKADQKTGRDAVDRLLAWKDTYFGVGLLVTNTSFTRDAVWTAQQERNARFLRLRDFIDIKRWLQDQWGTEEDWREIPDRVELAPGVVIEIPKPRIATLFNLNRGGDE